MIASFSNSAANWSQVVLAAGVILGGVGWLLNTFKRSILDEVRSNGGDSDSTGDRIVRIEEGLKTHIASDEKVQTTILARLDEIPKPKPTRRRTTS